MWVRLVGDLQRAKLPALPELPTLGKAVGQFMVMVILATRLVGGVTPTGLPVPFPTTIVATSMCALEVPNEKPFENKEQQPPTAVLLI